jgi:hypothetical protein
LNISVVDRSAIETTIGLQTNSAGNIHDARNGEGVFGRIQDVEFLVHRCDERINSEFREFLVEVGCSAATITQAGY